MIDVVSIIALFMGPLIAVVVAWKLDDRRAKNERRMDVFRKLMSTRSNTLSFDHVSALNLVEIEFHGNSKVVRKWKKYFDSLGTVYPKREEEKILESLSSAEIVRREENYDKRVIEIRSKLLTELLHEMARVLGYKKIEVLEILKGSYLPQGWVNVEYQQEIMRRYFIDLYLGKRALPVLVRSEEPPTNGEQKPLPIQS